MEFSSGPLFPSTDTDLAGVLRTSHSRYSKMPEITLPPSAPVLSTPDTRIFEHGPENAALENARQPRLSDEQLYITYEIERTVNEIREGKRRRIALQFPDHLLVDAPRISQALARGLRSAREENNNNHHSPETRRDCRKLDKSLDQVQKCLEEVEIDSDNSEEPEKLFILADTSYGSCCVDETAAEHADADVVVHYGRSCLSPTSRLPVIYVFTKPPLAMEIISEAFQELYPDTRTKVIVMADVPFTYCVPVFAHVLRMKGYASVFATALIHETNSPLPNRTVPPEVQENQSALIDWRLFHISEPPESLLLNISSRVSDIHIFPTTQSPLPSSCISVSTAVALRRRYALLTRLSTVPIFGILINTLSVRNYMSILRHVKQTITAAGKKSYTFVVGKVNPAKLANFAEVGGWIVIGCWESSLFNSKDFWRPIITPFELEIALQRDAERTWTGEWTSDFQHVLKANGKSAKPPDMIANTSNGYEADENKETFQVADSEEESEPPEFDLRTGQYVSRSRPLPHGRTGNGVAKHIANGSSNARALIKRSKADVAKIGEEASPAAEFFKEKRSWQGLGGDFPVEYNDVGAPREVEGAAMEEGRCGIAKGYTVGDENIKH